MIDALFSGISGLNSNQSALNLQSNNLANVNTVAYKSDQISFADMMYENSIGKGSFVQDVKKNLSQGNLKPTSNVFDLAVDGKGYFVVRGDSAENLYTRTGNFIIANDGKLKTQNGFNVQGISAVNAEVLSSNANENIFTDEYSKFIASQIVKLNNNELIQTINIKVSNYEKNATDDDITQLGNNYKTKEAKITDINKLISIYSSEIKDYASLPNQGIAPTYQSSNIQIDTSKLNTNQDAIEIQIGNKIIRENFSINAQETLNNFANKISLVPTMQASVDASGLLTIQSLIPGDKVIVENANITSSNILVQNYIINTTNAQEGSGKLKLDAIENQLKTLVENADSKFLKITSSVDYSDIQNKTFNDLQLKLTDLNLSDNEFADAQVDNGIIYLNQGESRYVVGKVVTSLFTNEYGLKPMGSNVYSKTRESGEAINISSSNKILSKVLELSNTSVAEGLVDLMVYQRAFEANSKSITTSDEFLKVAIQLKK